MYIYIYVCIYMYIICDTHGMSTRDGRGVVPTYKNEPTIA